MGNIDTFGTGDCPDFYPIPPPCPRCRSEDAQTETTGVRDSAGTRRPGQNVGKQDKWTHVKAGGFKGLYTLGTYDEGRPNTTGTWMPSNVTAVQLDHGGPDFFYAAKSMWDGVCVPSVASLCASLSLCLLSLCLSVALSLCRSVSTSWSLILSLSRCHSFLHTRTTRNSGEKNCVWLDTAWRERDGELKHRCRYLVSHFNIWKVASVCSPVRWSIACVKRIHPPTPISSINVLTSYCSGDRAMGDADWARPFLRYLSP